MDAPGPNLAEVRGGGSFGVENVMANLNRCRVTVHETFWYSDNGAPLLEHFKQYMPSSNIN